ncbi:hypothetical protein DFQ27_000396 [Actinomortierella ambigua]|uniref:Actin-like ATPase domain-containing protein n=1 Tax=Actinomortierella ambigua TaxID=1343610 RepID=A0A9P6PNF4_9FUNG|nr:hypothetical protein DFQ27_000396 [Actinomortierella ambigua]
MSSSTLDKDFPVLVAIDFGTTFSGCAYAYTPHDKVPKLISEWPSQNMHYAKTPTVSLYKKANGRHKMAAWGWNSTMQRGPPGYGNLLLYKYKIHLDENVDMPAWTHPVSVPNAISDYLKALHDYAAEKIGQELGRRFTRKDFRYCLTVPAMWSDRAKDTMRKAAVRAGLIKQSDHPDRLILVTEPEAAALYCERECKEYNLKHGDRFLICDAGGGTVDLIVYDITESAAGRSLAEVTKGHGASCGSMLIDLNFGNLLIEKFAGQSANIPDDIIPKLVEKFAYAHKPHFNGVDDLYVELPWVSFFNSLKDPDAIGIDEGVMCFAAAELKEKVFDPVVERVLALIRDQLDKATKCSAIFLVGGFGSSTYLLNRVTKEFGTKVKIISKPHRPEIAVVFGAVYAGMEPRKVTARVTRCCYGVGGNGNSRGGSIPVFVVDGNPPRYTTNLSSSAFIRIPDVFKATDPAGHEVPYKLKFYFGLSEIRVEAIVLGRSHQTRLQFDDIGVKPSR